MSFSNHFEDPIFQNPIVTEADGTKRFRMQFDASAFKPENVRIKADSKENTLTISISSQESNSSFESVRNITVPKGVALSEIVCNFKVNGVLELSAPYVAPEEPNDTDIPVKRSEDTVINVEHK